MVSISASSHIHYSRMTMNRLYKRLRGLQGDEAKVFL
jgi:hypothetical protein